ncbi:hypothetical protein BD779DRAFT_1804024 [Infundibulicybe gibba]|nr:hypothetical protein BD779DRAFT_1804024 [Infundibulicybe gibba]
MAIATKYLCMDDHIRVRDPTLKGDTTASPRGYLLDYPIGLLTRIFELVCVDDQAAGRSLCLVSKGFYMAMRPVMFHWMQLKKPTQILRLAHLVLIGVAARAGTRRLTIDIPKLGKALLHEELDWSERDGIGSFHWDPSVWGDPDLDSEGSDEPESLDESESSDEYSDTSLSDEEIDIEEDVAFFISSEGRLEKWPWDDGLEKAEALVNTATSNIVHAVAPALRNLELISMDPRLSVALPIFPELSELTIHVTQLHFLAACSRVLFPVLKYLCIQGKLDKDYIDLDDLIYHAPSITKMRVPFGRDFLRVLIGKLAIPSLHGTTSIDGEGRMFEYVEEICVDHSIDDEADKVFGPDEPLFATWKRNHDSSPSKLCYPSLPSHRPLMTLSYCAG